MVSSLQLTSVVQGLRVVPSKAAQNIFRGNHILALEVNCLRNTPSTAGYSMTGSERPSPEPLLKKEAPAAVLGGEATLEMLWKPQMP